MKAKALNQIMRIIEHPSDVMAHEDPFLDKVTSIEIILQQCRKDIKSYKRKIESKNKDKK